jgi:predicted enzyme related to lactoylglutathione lyase
MSAHLNLSAQPKARHMVRGNAMADGQQRGVVHWIDHYIVCTNDLPRWEAFHAKVLGAITEPTPPEAQGLGIFQKLTRGRQGGFISKAPLPPTRGLGKGLPRYAFFICAEDIDAHLRRLDEAGAVHSAPVRVTQEGADGTAIYWQDPDGNQFEFWAPDAAPAGAMTDCGPERVGRISHGVFESRDLDRTAAFFGRYCALAPLKSADVSSDTLVLPLASGGRMIFRKVDELGRRTTGCGLTDAHTALVVRDEDFFFNYERIWAELPEWRHDVTTGDVVANGENMAPRTVRHPSGGGLRFYALTNRGDDFFDWDTNMFHFFGGEPIDGSMSLYTGRSIQHYVEQLSKTRDGEKRLVEMAQG